MFRRKKSKSSILSVSDAAANMLHTFALNKKIGAVNMMKKLLKPLSKKQRGKPKPLERRGSVLYNLIESLEGNFLRHFTSIHEGPCAFLKHESEEIGKRLVVSKNNADGFCNF